MNPNSFVLLKSRQGSDHKLEKVPLPVPRKEKETDTPALSGQAFDLFQAELKRSHAVARSSGSLPSRRNKRRKAASMSPNLPPKLNITPVLRRTFRFGCTTSGSYTITIADLAGACGGICTVVNTTLKAWASAVKVHRFRIWNPSTTSAVQVAEVVWFAVGTNQGREDVKDVALPTGVTMTRMVDSSPPPNTLAWFWQTTVSNTNSICQLQVDAGSVIDVDISYQLSNQLASPTLAIATGVLSTVYYLPLDGAASNKLQQLGVPTTA